MVARIAEEKLTQMLLASLDDNDAPPRHDSALADPSADVHRPPPGRRPAEVALYIGSISALYRLYIGSARFSRLA